MIVRAISFALLALLASASPAAATMTLGRLPLATVTAESGRIVHATVADVRSDVDESGAPATWVTFDVQRTLKGSAATRVTVKQFGRGANELGHLPGTPGYARGEEVVVFLRRESARGFTSPVGLADGVYRVTTRDGRRTARTADASGGDKDLDAFLAEVEGLVAAQRK
jgi:hypothetical protein